MKIILNCMHKPDFTSAQTAELEVFLFKYLYKKNFITDEDFKKVCGNRLKGCKFPVEFQHKLNDVYRQCVRTFLAEQKDVRFLSDLQPVYPHRAKAASQYVKQCYYAVLRQLLKDHHTQRMRQKYRNMMLSGRSMLADAGLAPVFGPQLKAKKGA